VTPEARAPREVGESLVGIPLRRFLRIFYPGRFSARRTKRGGAPFNWKRFLLIQLLLLVLVKAGLFLFYYNSLLSLQYDVEEAQARVDTQLQRRKNIIMNLNIMVMDYAEHERDIFTHTSEIRKEMLASAPEAPPMEGRDAENPNPGEGAQPLKGIGDLEAMLSKVFAIAERYPDLRLSENFQHFMDALVDAENKIAEERMLYNKRANEMSTKVGKFPGFIFARLYGFESPPFFEPEDEARNPPKVNR